MSRPPPAVLLSMAGGIVIVAWVATAPGHTADVVYMMVTGPAALVAALAARTAPPAHRRAALLLSAGLGLLWGGDLLWTVWDWRGLDPEPSVADLAYLAGYAVLGAGIVVLLMPSRAGRRRVDADVVVDVLTVVSVCVLAMWELTIRDAVDGTSGSLMSALRRTELVYPLVDAVLVGLVLGAMVNRTSRRLLGVGFGVGVLCWMVGDFAYLVPAPEKTAEVSSIAWLVGTLLVAIAVLRLSQLETPAASTPTATPRTTARLLLAVGPLVVPPLLVVVETLTGRDPESWSLVVGIAVLIALAFVRTERLLATERRIREELAATRDEALQASRAKSVFLASISHEIRTPMNGVLGLTRLLADTELDAEQRHYADGINRAGESLMALLGEVLDFAKLEDGRTQLDAADVDLVTVIEDTAAMVAAQAHHQGIELVAHTAADVPRHLCGDPAKLRQVLLNLAANAVAWTSTGEVVIRAALAPPGPGAAGPHDSVVVRFEVRDTGVGIAEADQRRIFDAFTQVEEDGHTARRGEVGGTGLGLAIARSLVEAMGGTIGVDSTPGVGSTFWCTVPLRRAGHRQVVVTRPSRAAIGARVLVADDNASHREMLAELLGVWGLRVDLASDGDQALDLLGQASASGTPYVVALIDVQMPGTGGLEVATRARVLVPGPTTPIVAMASGPLPTAELRRAGVEVSLPKPVRTAQLQAAVQRALGADPDRGPERAEPAASRGVVLVVDDSEVNRLVASGMLGKLGYLSDVALDGRQAVEMASTRHYDAVLMDCRMPVLDGYQAAAEIRRLEQDRPQVRRVPIVALTAHAVPGEREQCLAAGMDDYLVKPLGRRPLAETLERWVPTPVA